MFLEWFAATCNVKLSAEKAGVAYQTVFKHRMKDERFADAWDRALAQGYARLEARLLEAAGGGPHPSAAAQLPPSPAGSRGEALEMRGDLDGPEVEAAFDTELAIVLLREHGRGLAGAGRSGAKRRDGRAPRVASNAEVAAALVKRLKSFGMRVRGER